MTPAESAGRALVLGGGGPVGTAWMAGLLVGLENAGVSLTAADRVLGTSAGAIIGAAITTGRDLRCLAHPPTIAHRADGLSGHDPARMREVFSIIGTPGLDAVEVRRRVGKLALTDRDATAEAAQLVSRRALIGCDVWSDRDLTIVAVDAISGKPVTWTRASGVSLVAAVAASSAFPGASPPIRIGQRHCIDGGLRSTTNADLAIGAGAIVVIAPLAHRVPGETLRREVETLGAAVVAVIAPDAASSAVFASDVYDRAAWNSAYQAGHQQAATAAEEISDGWGH